LPDWRGALELRGIRVVAPSRKSVLRGDALVSALPRIDWYFDFISPFAYLACERLGELDGLAEIHPVPVLFAGLLDHYGQRGPAEIGPKRTFTYRFALWRASRLGVPLRLPPAHPFNPLKLLRLAVALGAGREAVREIFRFVWRDGCSADDPQALAVLGPVHTNAAHRRSVRSG
jgi:2-hydroxychromene-2-carboxylate isomerase